MSKLALFFLALLMLVAGSTVLVLAYRTTTDEQPVASGTSQERVLPAEPLEDFTLTAQNGQQFDSSSLKGDVWIASFFFASCPATCRRQNEAIADLQRRYGDQGVKFVSISVDPASDDPQTLSTYAQGFNADPDQWFFLTDRSKSIDYIRRVGNDIFKVMVKTQGHADTLILVNQNGVIPENGYYNWKDPARVAELNADIERLLAEGPREPEAPADEAVSTDTAAEDGTAEEEASEETTSVEPAVAEGSTSS